MKKFIFITLLLANIIFILSTSVNAEDIARLKNININESDNSIDFNLMSSKNIRYNIINYMNGDVGIKLLNTTLSNHLSNNKEIDISQKDSIKDATLIQEGPYSVVIKLKGDEDLKNKPINITNDVQKSNFIIIEPINKPETRSIRPLITDMPDIPEVTKLQLNQSIESPIEEVTVKEPISMYNEKVNTEKYAQGKMLIAQAQPFSDDTTILDLEDKPLSTTTTEEDTLTPPSNASELTEEETVDDLNVDNTTSTIEEPVEETPSTEATNSTENKEPGFFGKIFGFLKAQWMWITGIVGCGIIGIIILVVIASAFGGSQTTETTQEQQPQQMPPEERHQKQGQGPQQQQQQRQQPEAAEIIDNEPVNYIPPSQTSSSQSITDAINQIIFIRNKSGK